MVERSGEEWPDVAAPRVPVRPIVLTTAVSDAAWAGMTPGQKQAALLAVALDYKRALLQATSAVEVTLDNAPLHNLFLRASDSIIEQVLAIEANALQRPVRDDIEKIFAERQKWALAEIERLSRGQGWKRGD